MTATLEMPGTSWAGTHTYRARRLQRPESIEELCSLIRSSSRIRALGTRHSFNDVADSRGDLVSLESMVHEPVIAADRRSVTVSSRMPYGHLGRVLEAEGLALHNLGSLPHISIGGATATGTHGSGDANGSLSTAVSGLELVDGRGEIIRLSRDTPLFGGMVIALGALGIVTAVTLDVQPSYEMRQDVYRGLPWEALDDVDAVFGAGYSVSVFVNWADALVDAVWVKTRAAIHDSRSLPAELLGGRREDQAPADQDNTTPRGVGGIVE